MVLNWYVLASSKNSKQILCTCTLNPLAQRKAQIVCNFGLSVFNGVYSFGLSKCNRVNIFSHTDTEFR